MGFDIAFSVFVVLMLVLAVLVIRFAVRAGRGKPSSRGGIRRRRPGDSP